MHTSRGLLCEGCYARACRAQRWERARGAELLSLCQDIGVQPRFCRGGKPPSVADDGLRERLAARPMPLGGLLIVGPVGSHKTHLLSARAVHYARCGLNAVLLKWPQFCLEVRATYQSDSADSESKVLARYTAIEYLGVDDILIGREDRPESDAALRLAYQLFDSRYERCLTTDVTTNALPAEIAARMDGRIARRISELTTVYPMLLNKEGQPELDG